MPPGPGFDARRELHGKTIFEIPITSEVPFVAAVERGMRQAAGEVGAKLVVYPTEGQPAQWAQGIETAIAQHADAITLFAQDPALLGPQIAKAEKARIPVIVLRTTGEGERCQADPAGKVYGSACAPAPFEQAGRLQADWVIQATNGNADALVITSNDASSTTPLMQGLRDEFRRRCPACKVTAVDVPISEWAARIRSEVQSALVRDPKIDYVIPIYDSMSQFVVPAIRARRAAGRVRLAAFNGTPFVPEIQAVRRDALAWWIPLLGETLVCLTTLAVDTVNYGGAITVATDPSRFDEDPFARIPGHRRRDGAVRLRRPARRPGRRAVQRGCLAGRQLR